MYLFNIGIAAYHTAFLDHMIELDLKLTDSKLIRNQYFTPFLNLHPLLLSVFGCGI